MPVFCGRFSNRGGFAFALLLGVCCGARIIRSVPLSNGGAESGTMAPWDAVSTRSVEAQSESAGTVYPFEGERFFSMAAVRASSASLRQTNALAPGTAWLFLSGAVQTEHAEADDFGTVVLSLLDDEGNTLAVVTNGPLNTPPLTWKPFEVVLAVPEGSAAWTLELKGTLVYGSYVNVFYDATRLYESPSVVLQKAPSVDDAGRPALSWFSGDTGLTYSVLSSTSLVADVFAPVPPSNQWPIRARSWTNSLPLEGELFFKIEAR